MISQFDILITNGSRGCAHMVVGFTTTYAICNMTIDVVSSNPPKGKVYNII